MKEVNLFCETSFEETTANDVLPGFVSGAIVVSLFVVTSYLSVVVSDGEGVGVELSLEDAKVAITAKTNRANEDLMLKKVI
jgi:hypothetical protein